MWKISSPSSTMPCISAEPPVSTIPDDSSSSKPERAQLRLHQRIELLDARLDHLGQRLARQLARRALADARHLDHLVRVGELAQRARRSAS